MKSLTVILSALLTSNCFALDVQVVSTHLQVSDEHNEKSLCLTVVKAPGKSELLGIVEDIGDCFYARAAKRAPHSPLRLDPRFLAPLSGNLLEHLQKMDSHLRFYFSDGE